jgi:hypothetical protein
MNTNRVLSQGMAPAGTRMGDRIETAFHPRYLSLVEEIEQRFSVARWKSGDVDIWPLARAALYLDMYWNHAHASPPRPSLLPLRIAGSVAMPLRNYWRARGHRTKLLARAHGAEAAFLGDGVSLDRVGEGWHDRFCEPLMEVMEAGERGFFMMQGGWPGRLPWTRPAMPANRIAARGLIRAVMRRPAHAELPDHEAVLSVLARAGENARSLGRGELERSANLVATTADEFERVLREIDPMLAFVVNCYSGNGPAFVLACRRLGILSVDLQHCPQDGAHRAYGFSTLPDQGYRTLPAVFWNWTQRDSDYINRWACRLAQPWHRGFHGGHPQLAAYLDEGDPRTREWEERFRAVGAGGRFEREILVALQPIHGQRERWEALAARIAAAPSSWRWWIRRHPAAIAKQDQEYLSLLSLRKPNVVVSEAATLPLPALLRHMSALVSLASGAAAEAAMFGVPAFFLHEESRGPFRQLIDAGQAAVVTIGTLLKELAAVPASARCPPAMVSRDISESLEALRAMAPVYSDLCRRTGNSPRYQ